MIQKIRDWQPWLSTAGRLFLAGVFLWAGGPKLIDPEGTLRSVRGFQILPEWAIAPFGYTLPIVELALAVLLILGLFTRIAVIITAGMMVMFLFGIGWAWARGLSINCGCFGNTGSTVTDPVPGYIRDILRDTGYLLVALLLIWRPHGRFGLDRRLGLVVPDGPDPAVS